MRSPPLQCERIETLLILMDPMHRVDDNLEYTVTWNSAMVQAPVRHSFALTSVTPRIELSLMVCVAQTMLRTWSMRRERR